MNNSLENKDKYSIYHVRIPRNEVVNRKELQKSLELFLKNNPPPYYIDLDRTDDVVGLINFYCVHILSPVINESEKEVILISSNIDKIMEANNILTQYLQPLGELKVSPSSYTMIVKPLNYVRRL